MRSSVGLVVVAAWMVGCGPTGSGDDTDTGDTDTGDTGVGPHTVTWSYDAVPGAMDPVFAAVQFDGGAWQEVTLVDGAVGLSSPSTAAPYRAVTVCEGTFGLTVEWVLSNLTDLPEPPLGCSKPDPARTVTVSGSVQNTSLATVYAGSGEDYGSPSDTYGIDVAPGTYDVVALEIASTPRMAARANVTATSDATVDLDYSTDLVSPDEATMTITGATYTEAWGVTERGTAFLAGSGDTIRTPPAASGITVDRVFIQANSANGVWIKAVDPGADVTETMPAADPFDFDVTADANDVLTVDLDPIADNATNGVVVVNTSRVQTTPTYVETRESIIATFDQFDGNGNLIVPGDPTAELPDFPPGALNGDFVPEGVTVTEGEVEIMSDLVFAMAIAQRGLSLDGRTAEGIHDCRAAFSQLFRDGQRRAGQ